jgi:hypothetical protein
MIDFSTPGQIELGSDASANLVAGLVKKCGASPVAGVCEIVLDPAELVFGAGSVLKFFVDAKGLFRVRQVDAPTDAEIDVLLTEIHVDPATATQELREAVRDLILQIRLTP